MPPLPAFHDAESYYATPGHEAVHWTRHPSYLDRDLGLTLEPREDHAAYLASWIKVLKRQPGDRVGCSPGRARHGLLHGLQPGQAAP